MLACTDEDFERRVKTRVERRRRFESGGLSEDVYNSAMSFDDDSPDHGQAIRRGRDLLISKSTTAISMKIDDALSPQLLHRAEQGRRYNEIAQVAPPVVRPLLPR
ncbi:hypothetical protein D8674_030787 [Pyrus ussuriensis x Pyrus communis]|uniref:Uncharacterized protein n=1 Tax=Pyrus ussuriensis x Pyrus communis TaxID=2448454 RepID=A0A5N5EX65_9ROSA|nr:hypothetical protein D8674_030787 [Pyrus ussuriensis x Pyrus communis]